MILLAHGGAGQRKPTGKALKILARAIRAGYEMLQQGLPALDAVIETIAMLEDSGEFNAGAGANLQLDRKRRLDAAIMDGGTLDFASVIGLQGFRNPVRVAREVLSTPHRILTHEGASRIARAGGFARLGPPSKKDLARLEKFLKKGGDALRAYEKYFSTVGAVALDGKGGLAAGSSTGGIALMLPGRVGDTPIPGAGVYAEGGLGAVTCTGRGEDILRVALAKEIVMRLSEKGPVAATRQSLKDISKLGGRAGVLALNRNGRFAIMHTTEHMASGYMNGKRIVVKDGFERVG